MNERWRFFSADFHDNPNSRCWIIVSASGMRVADRLTKELAEHIVWLHNVALVPVEVTP